QVLEGLEAVRRRPGMYIGTTDLRGLHHLVREVLDNSIDEAMNGTCDRIDLWIHKTNEITVADNGRGIPVGPHPTQKDAKGKPMDAHQAVMTILHDGGKFGGAGYKVTGGLHRVSVPVVNALATEIVVELHSDEQVINRSHENLHPKPVYVERTFENSTIAEVALQYNDTFAEKVYTFANNINTIDGGAHLTGFRTALTRTINAYARKSGALKESDPNLT